MKNIPRLQYWQFNILKNIFLERFLNHLYQPYSSTQAKGDHICKCTSAKTAKNQKRAERKIKQLLAIEIQMSLLALCNKFVKYDILTRWRELTSQVQA
jgi:hypothetical protein